MRAPIQKVFEEVPLKEISSIREVLIFHDNSGVYIQRKAYQVAFSLRCAIGRHDAAKEMAYAGSSAPPRECACFRSESRILRIDRDQPAARSPQSRNDARPAISS